MKHLIIGGGSVGTRHLRNLSLLGENHLYCLRREKDEHFEEEYRCRVLTYNDIPANLNPDIIYICTPTSIHHKNLVEMSGLNAHVFMEKPLTHSWSSLEMIKSLSKNLKIFFIGYMLRYHPAVIKINELLKQKAIGQIFSARFEFGSYLPGWHPDENYRLSYASKKELGGGVINTISHELDLMMHLFGEPKSVIAMAHNTGQLEIDVEEIAEAIFEYDFGITSIHLDYLQKEYKRTVSIYGDKGSIEWKWSTGMLHLRVVGEAPVNFSFENFEVNEMYLSELKDFLKLVKKPQKHTLDLNYAILNTEWVLGMHESVSQEVKWVK